jgi:hypothetical protein
MRVRTLVLGMLLLAASVAAVAVPAAGDETGSSSARLSVRKAASGSELTVTVAPDETGAAVLVDCAGAAMTRRLAPGELWTHTVDASCADYALTIAPSVLSRPEP